MSKPSFRALEQVCMQFHAQIKRVQTCLGCHLQHGFPWVPKGGKGWGPGSVVDF